ncbi:MAG: DUF1667 domain-containing protein [Bacilli bacterium]|jgi:CxxC motif-containing protein
MKLTCIICPNGCALEIDEKTMQVTGYKCSRGAAFAVNELTDPRRSITSTVKTTLPEYPVVSVRSDGDLPKALIGKAISLLKTILVDEYLSIGTIIVNNVLDTGVNIITTTAMYKGDTRI